jgi:HlyD family secretion protein
MPRARVNEAEGRLAAAEAQLAQAQAAHAQAKWDREAMARLFQKELVAEQEALRARSNEEAQAAIVAAQRRQVDAECGALTAAKANLVNPAIRSSQVVVVQGQILQAQADIAAAQAEAERARSSKRRAPTEGTSVSSRHSTARSSRERRNPARS